MGKRNRNRAWNSQNSRKAAVDGKTSGINLLRKF
jgi:hypothetical protein